MPFCVVIFSSTACFALGVTQEELVYDVRTHKRQLGTFAHLLGELSLDIAVIHLVGRFCYWYSLRAL